MKIRKKYRFRKAWYKHMTKSKKTAAMITGVAQLQLGIYSIWIKEEETANLAKPGQFISVYVKDKTRLLPRPISICEIDKENGLLRLVYRVAGEGTKELSHYGVGTYLEILGPLGNGFFINEVSDSSNSILIGGGIGIPPMLELAKQLPGNKTIVLGYRDKNTFLADEFKQYGTVLLATDDGSLGTKGTVIDALHQHSIEGSMIFACGPTLMLRGVKEYAKEHKISAQISMEERMACGIGACLACVCKSKEKDPHTNVANKRICKDGPVFYADTIEL